MSELEDVVNPESPQHAVAPTRPIGRTRARAILGMVIGMLLLLLAFLVLVFFRLLNPIGDEQRSSRQSDGLLWVRSIYGFGPSPSEQLESPSSVAIGPDGLIYATDPIRARIMVFRPDGTFVRLIRTASTTAGSGNLARPESIAVGDDGLVYVADSWLTKVIVFDHRGRFVREWPVDRQARGLAVGRDSVYVLDVGEVIIFDRTGHRRLAFGTRGNGEGQLDAYQGITARDGRIYVADSYNRRIQVFDERGKLLLAVPSGTVSPAGASLEATSSDASSSTAVPSHAWSLPQDLVFDRAGRLIVVDAFNFELAAVDPSTLKVTASYGSYGRVDGQFYYPTSVAYDHKRDWFAVADTQNDRIEIVRLPGSGASALSGAWRLVSSPYRYLVIPLLLLALSAVAAVLTSRLMSRRGSGEESAGSAGQSGSDEVA